MRGRPREAERRQLALHLWLAYTAEDAQASDMGRRERAIAHLNPQAAFPGGLRNKIVEAVGTADSFEEIQRFEAIRGRVGVLSSRELSTKCVAAILRCRGTLREMTGRPHLPPTEEAVVARSAYFLAGRAYQGQGNHASCSAAA